MLTIKIGDLLKLSKVTNILKSDIEVVTPSGLKKIYDVDITAKNSEIISLKTKKHELLCSPDHLIKSNNKWVKSKNFKIGEIVDTKYGKYSLTEISILNYREDLLDLHVDTNEYYTNDILSHNSSIIDSFDYVLFKEVAGKSKKKLRLSSIPNRINKNMEVIINFEASDGTEIKVVRGHEPSNLELWENGIENKRAGAGKINQKIIDYIGMDLATFKGFISMSVNDFKNFISLSNEDKKLLLDKLFNLEVINILNKILNSLIKENEDDLDLLEKEIELINESLDNSKTSVETLKSRKEESQKQKIKSIKEKITKNLKIYKNIKEKMELIKEKKSFIETKISDEKSRLAEIKTEIKQLNEQLNLLDNDKCPTCLSDLDTNFHVELKGSFVERKEANEKLRDETITYGQKLTKSLEKIKSLHIKGTDKYNEMNSTLKSLKNDLTELEGDNDDNFDLDEFEKQIDKLNQKKKKVEINQSVSNDKQIYHKSIKSILSENGVKRTIIKNIVTPINKYIDENLRKMHLPFEVVLDDTFSANITFLGEEIDVDTLSTGESKLISISIMLSYLRLIRTKKQINVLFLDEIFSSVDVERIDNVISLLSDLSNQTNINIFLVHHSILNSQHFDRILKVEKDIFSYIEEIKNI